MDECFAGVVFCLILCGWDQQKKKKKKKKKQEEGRRWMKNASQSGKLVGSILRCNLKSCHTWGTTSSMLSCQSFLSTCTLQMVERWLLTHLGRGWQDKLRTGSRTPGHFHGHWLFRSAICHFPGQDVFTLNALICDRKQVINSTGFFSFKLSRCLLFTGKKSAESARR